jgi:hypothetical protein
MTKGRWDADGTDYGDNRVGRKLPRRAPARPRLPRCRSHAAVLDRHGEPHRAPPRPHRARERRPLRPDLPPSASRPGAAGRGLQPRRPPCVPTHRDPVSEVSCDIKSLFQNPSEARRERGVGRPKPTSPRVLGRSLVLTSDRGERVLKHPLSSRSWRTRSNTTSRGIGSLSRYRSQETGVSASVFCCLAGL